MNTTNTTPSTVSNPVSRAAVDEAVRIAADSSRRTTDSAQAAIAAGQQFFDVASQTNRNLFALWTSVVEATLQTTFAAQNAALATGQTLFDTSAGLNKDALNRWSSVARQAQATTLNAYQSSTKLFDSLTHG